MTNRESTMGQSPIQDDIIKPSAAVAVKGDSMYQPTTLQLYLVIILLFLVLLYNQVILMKELQKMSETINTLEAAIQQQ
jgi:hypothetical protein